MGTGAILAEPAIGMREKRVDAQFYRIKHVAVTVSYDQVWREKARKKNLQKLEKR